MLLPFLNYKPGNLPLRWRSVSKEANSTSTLTGIKRTMPQVECYLHKRFISVNVHLVAHALEIQTHLLYMQMISSSVMSRRMSVQCNYRRRWTRETTSGRRELHGGHVSKFICTFRTSIYKATRTSTPNTFVCFDHQENV